MIKTINPRIEINVNKVFCSCETNGVEPNKICAFLDITNGYCNLFFDFLMNFNKKKFIRCNKCLKHTGDKDFDFQ